MQLASSDVDRYHPLDAALQEAVGETAGGGARIKSLASCRVHAEMLKRSPELLPSSAHIPRGFTRESHRFTRSDKARRLRGRRATHQDLTGIYQSCGPRPGLGQPQFHQGHVESTS